MTVTELFDQNDTWLAQDFPAPWYVRVWRALFG
jgi:hypothetical protein